MPLIPYTSENRDKIMAVAERLMGTCKNLDDVVQDVFEDEGLDATSDIDIKLLYELDETVMLCESCGWWCEPVELDDEQICEDCRRA